MPELLTVDDVLKALADPTRRTVVEQLGLGPATTTQLARHHDMALPSFIQHLDVLERAGVVTSHKAGRSRTYALQPRSLDALDEWLRDQHDLWTRRLDQLDGHLARMKERHP